MYYWGRSHPRYLVNGLLFVAILFSVFLSSARGQGTEMDPPVLITPVNGELTTVENYPPLAIPSFAWNPVSGATLYQLQVDTSPSFTSPAIDIHTANLHYTPTGAGSFQDGIYYWRVKVEEPIPGSPYSAPYLFTKSWASVQNSPILLAPTEDAILAFVNDPAFSWQPVTGAVSYRLQIATTPDGFNTPVYTQNTAATHHQPLNKLANGRYYWRVIPIDPSGFTGTPSMVRSFTMAYGSTDLSLVPILLSPSPNSLLSFTPTFQWTAVIGAQTYQLEYTPGPVCNFAVATAIATSQTSYTPPVNLPNPSLYCWRVRVQSGSSVGDWSEQRTFTYSWDLTARLLTPTLAYPFTRTPIFSWTPVPGSAKYKIELFLDTLDDVPYSTNYTSNPIWVSPTELPATQYVWQITPIDKGENSSTPSQPFTFKNPLTATVPTLVYPLHYYPPNDPSSVGDVILNPVEDRTVAFPLFIWQRVLNPPPFGGLSAREYRLQVSLNPYFSPLVWQIDTENTSATPTLDYPFVPQAGQDYYWRVCPLNLLTPTCQVDPYISQELWSQISIARFDSALSLSPPAESSPQLLRPVNAHEQVEGTPLLEWLPLTGATHYHIQISRDPYFTDIEHEDFPSIPIYASPRSLAQRNLGRTDYGTFYWRVCGFVDGSYSPWSEVRRFQIASQSEWRRVRTTGDSQNKLTVGRDPIADTSSNFDLSTLYVSQSDQAWFIGFNTAADPVINKTIVIFIDTDHQDGSGGSSVPERPYLVSSIPAHEPEYVLYIDQINGVFTAQTTSIYTWTGVAWGYSHQLSSLGGELVYTPGAPGYLEIKLPDLAFALIQSADSLALIAFTVNDSGVVLDTVPTDPAVPGSAVLSRFTSVSDRMNLIFPPNKVNRDPSTIPSLLPLFWDWPTGSDPTGSDFAPATPFAGAQLQIAIDPQFTIKVADLTFASNAHYLGSPVATLTNDLIGNATYYWRVRPRYLNAGIFFGAWSSTFQFTRAGFTPKNLHVSTNLTTPEFRWDRAEGAAYYQLQVSTQSDFDPSLLDLTTPNTSYTPLNSLAQGTYYWRVGILRQDVSQPGWSDAQSFEVTLPSPSGLSPDDPSQFFDRIPTLCWQPILTNQDNIPLVSAWKYRLQVSSRSDFQTITSSIETEMNCWTPQSWFLPGLYYWRVAMIDAAGYPGSYSAPAAFYLQIPTTTLLNPISGWISSTPTFTWTHTLGMASYRLEVSLEPDFYPLLDWAQTANTQYTSLFTYPVEGLLYWRVAAHNSDGIAGAFISTHIAIGSPRVWLPMIMNK